MANVKEFEGAACRHHGWYQLYSYIVHQTQPTLLANASKEASDWKHEAPVRVSSTLQAVEASHDTIPRNAHLRVALYFGRFADSYV
jgi:hypothetical protein